MHEQRDSEAYAILARVAEFSSSDQRMNYLDDACSGNHALRERVEQLLGVYQQVGDFLENSPRLETSDHVSLPLATALMEGPGSWIGPYKLMQQIGEGGFGVVYMAEQITPVNRMVALKIIKPGMETREVIARFEVEQRALALMDHPNIARVLDGGVTDSGRPYFVMELVKGIPLTDFCDQSKLSARERLELFATVCRAVQHAHQKGIIHRDIKPSNVMVTLHDGQPVPKVIDFGVSKAISQKLTEKTMFTAYGQMIGTPQYMSPEQAEMSGLDIDTRSDIYSLGVLLYELLTGTTPLEAPRFRGQLFAELQRLIREEEAPRPSTRVSTLGKATAAVAAKRGTDAKKLRALLRGELDWIVMKALEKDRSRRYETANSFASDVQRYLDDEPVAACPPTAGYRLQKLVRRHKTAIATSAVVAAALVAGTIVSTWQAIRATSAAERATASERKLRNSQQELQDRRRVATAKVTEALNEAKLHEGRADVAELDEQVTELELAIKSAELVCDLTRQGDVEGIVQANADQLLRGLTERAATAQEKAAQAAADRELQTELEQIRLSQADQGERLALTGATFFSVGAADKRYEVAFRKAGLDVLALDVSVSKAAAQISGRNEALRESIIAGLDNWVRTIAASPRAPEDQYHRYVQAGDYAAAARMGLSFVEQDPATPELWLRLAPVLVLDGDEAAYREFCRRMAEQFAAENVQSAEQTLKACLLLPGAVDLAELPQSTLAAFLEDGNPPEWFLPWALFARALFEYRSGDYESALKYAQESEAHHPIEYAQALNRAVSALAHHQLGHAKESRSNLEAASAIVDGLQEKEYNPVYYHDLLITQILLREVALLLDGNVSPELLAAIEPDSANVAASSAKRLTRRERLLAVADKADPNPWRIKLRANLKDPDIAALKELATSEKTTEQSSELNAWLGAVLREAEELDVSIAVLKEAQMNAPGDFWLNHELAKSLLYSGKPTEAVEFARAALAVKPNSLGSLLTLSDTLGEAGRNEDYYRVRRKILTLLPLGIEDAIAIWRAGQRPRALDKLDDRIAMLRGYTDEYPDDAKGHLLLAMTLGNASRERLEDALPPLRRFIELKPGNTANYAYFAVYLGNMLTYRRQLPEAIDAYRLGTQFDPENATMWLRLARALALAGEKAEYRENCQEIVKKFAGTEVVNASIVCKACLLMPDAIDLAELPQEIVATSLDEGTAPRWCYDEIAFVSYPQWGWNTRALLAYRSGNSEAAIQYVQKSEESNPDDFARALNLTILALAHQKLGHVEEARSFAADAAKAIENPGRANDFVVHHLLISQVLLREAESNR